MARSAAFRSFARLMIAAVLADRRHCSAQDALGSLREYSPTRSSRLISRRRFLVETAAVGATLAFGTQYPRKLATAKSTSPTLSVGIVGAGLAGLACADTLKTRGIRASIYDAGTRSGGRCWSLRGFFSGQVAERGGELIDTLHKTMLGYAKRFSLKLEDVNKAPGEVIYYFSGQRYTEAVVVAEFREFVSIMRTDLHRLSRDVTAIGHTTDDAALDQISLLAYLGGQNTAGIAAGPVAKAAIIAAYEAEYGRAASEQSCLNFLLFMHPDRRSTFTPFGVFGDERYHLVDGNDRIIEGLTRELPGQITYNRTLLRVRRVSDGRIELTFQEGAHTAIVTHDVAVLAIPFSTLRLVELDASLTLPPAQRQAILTLGYGTNAKMNIGFSSRPWHALSSDGTSYSDLSNHQTTWESNPTRGSDTRAILLDYSSGQRGARLNPTDVHIETQRFLQDLNHVYPGALEAATLIQGRYLAHLEHWPSNPLTQGSYTCYRPGQFTAIAGLEGVPAGNLFFAGEHTNSFYEWQGFMEGAALSGITAARSILATTKAR
ncbi:MAG: FAD-dependent oxidoreductase [Nitrospira sp.]|nr:FAD-dependent oxidoreductase [Nitrospira sp.]